MIRNILASIFLLILPFPKVVTLTHFVFSLVKYFHGGRIERIKILYYRFTKHNSQLVGITYI